MHRIARFLVLLVFGLARAGALECPMASAAHDAGAPGHAAPMAMHAHPSHAPPAGDPHAPAHGPASCSLVTSCGAAAAPSPGAAVIPAPIRLSAAPQRLPYLYASPVLNTDSPPPRAASAA